MARIALRAYIREITDQIDNHQIEEAISHCRHILEQYPKHVDTYRLLGKAYLEEQRYSDAADILQRVLSSIPDDFISHIGMSIIREDEGNIDAAIYHMELAFETQPSNHAIQNELRRLHGVRDGIEPARIRLTRGALSRMYAHGHLYDQAIAELQAAISEDAQRLDLLTLLAEMYFQADKKVDTAETCTKILEKLPYCLSANQLLAKILSDNGRTAEADRYKMRWESLDPYAQFVDEGYASIDDVPEESITVERLEWEPEAYYSGDSGQPDWASSLGMTIEEKKPEGSSSIPDWLTPGDEQESEKDLQSDEDNDTELNFAALPASTEDDWPELDEEKDELGLLEAESKTPQGEEDFFASLKEDTIEEDALPDFLGGFEKSEDTEEEDWLASLGEPEEDDAPTEEAEAEAEDDWFNSLVESSDESAPTLDEEAGDDDWINSLESAESETAPTAVSEAPSEDDEADDWLASLESAEGDTAPSAVSETPAEEDEEADDWLSSLGETTEAEPPSLEPLEDGDDDWLSALESAEDDTAPSAVRETPAEEGEEADDWLASLGETTEAEPPSLEPLEDGDDDWLSALGEPEEKQSPEESDADEIEIPEFLREAGWEERTGDEGDFKPVEYVDEEEQTEEIEQGKLPPWLQEMAPEEETAPKPATSDLMADLDPEWVAEADSQTMETPDWLTELGEEEEETAPEPTPPTEEIGQGVELEADEMDMAWLESLAAKQGIPDEELVTTPEQRSQVEEGHTPEIQPDEEDITSPDLDDDNLDTGWLAEISQEAAQEAAETSMEPPATEAEEEDDWLAGLGQEPAKEQEDEDEDDWLAELGTPEETPDQSETLSFAVDTETAGEDADDEDDWLAGLAEDEEKEKETTEAAPTPTVLEEEDDFDMDWLNEIGQEAAQEAAATAPEPAMEEAEQEDDWLAGLGQESAEEQEEDEDEDDWLAELGTPEETPDQSETLSFAVDTETTDEDEADFDMDWHDEIGQEAAQETAATAPEPATEEAEQEDDWLAGLGQESAEEQEEDEDEDDWLAELGTPEETPGQDETLSLSLDEEEVDEEEDDWLAGLGQETTEEQEEDDDWLTELGTPEETPDQSETLSFAVDTETTNEDDGDEDDWLAGLVGDEEEETAEAAPSPAVLEEEDDFDMDWLDEIGQEAAEEAAATSAPEPATEETEEPAEPDWLAGLAEDEEEEATEAAPSPAVLEEEDDFDMDWLDEIGQEAAEEAAATSAPEPATEETEEPAEPDWLAGLAEDEEEEATEAAPSPAVLEEEDDFDMDWLDEIGQEAAQEAAATTPEPATEETEEPAEPDWLAGLAADQTETDEEEDWLADLSGTSTEAETEAEPPQAVSAEEEPQEPEEESDALNTDWLHQIGQEAAQEAAATSIEPAAEETEGAVSDEETPPWLASIEQANVSDQALSSDDTIGRFISDLEADQPAEQEEEAPPPPAEEDEFDMDWLAEVSEDEPESEAETFLPEEEPAEPETFEPAEEAPTEEQVPSLDIEDTGVWLASLGVEELETEEQADEEEEAPEDIPTWLKEPQVEEEPTITPTKADEWVPEFNEAPENAPEPELEQEPAQAETTPEPAAEPVAEPDIQLDPKSPEGILENSRTLIQEGHLDAGIAGYNKLIKKGKMVGSVIEDIQAAIQRHPVESNLWQTLGDAYLRMDNLQEALDAYTKAEELLR